MRPTTGCSSIAPIGKHYCWSTLGLPWWTGAEKIFGSAVTPWANPRRFGSSIGFGDYVLFRGTIDAGSGGGPFRWQLEASRELRQWRDGRLRYGEDTLSYPGPSQPLRTCRSLQR